MRRRPIFYACLAAALAIIPLGAKAQTGTSGSGGTGTTGTTGTRGTTSTGTTTMGQPGVTGSGVMTGTPRVGDPYEGPGLSFSSTPDIQVIPGTDIGYIRNADYDMFRSGTNWYYRYQGRWYRGTSYNGPFTYVTTTAVPRTIRTVPVHYRHTTWTMASVSRNGVSGTRHHVRTTSASRRTTSRHRTRTTSYSGTTRRHASVNRPMSTTPNHENSHQSDMDQSGTTMGGTVGQPYNGPAISFRTQPTVAIVPGTRVSYLRNADYDMYRYGSDWYMNYNGTWYRASNYSGPYTSVDVTTVPQPIMVVPMQYRRHWR